MKDVSELIQRKGQGLVNRLENSRFFARYNLPQNATDEQKREADIKAETLTRVIKEVREVFELEK